MSLAALAVFATALLVNAGSPGPSVAALVARVIDKGIGSVLPFLAAMWIGELAWLIAAVLGLGFVAESFHTLFLIVKYIGVAYLAWLAFKMWTAPVKAEAGDLPSGHSPWGMFFTGLALTIGNPKIMLFYLALLPALIDISHISLGGTLALVLTALLVMMVVDLGWASAAQWARGWLKSPRAMRISNRFAATAMGGAAVAIATR